MKLLIPFLLLATSVCYGKVTLIPPVVCVKDPAELAKQHDSLPECLRELPIIFVVDGFFAKGAISVRAIDGRLISESHSIRDPHSKASEPTPIKNACVGKDEKNQTWVTVELVTGAKNELMVTGKATVDYQGTELKLSSQETFNRVVRGIHHVAPSANDNPGMN